MSETIHIKKFDAHLRRTPQEMHQMFAFPPHATCLACGGRPAIRAITLAPVKDAIEHNLLPPMSPEELNHAYQYIVPIRQTAMSQPEPFIRIGMVYSCLACKPVLIKAMAALPSWVCVEINEGPDPANKVVLAV